MPFSAGLGQLPGIPVVLVQYLQWPMAPLPSFWSVLVWRINDVIPLPTNSGQVNPLPLWHHFNHPPLLPSLQAHWPSQLSSDLPGMLLPWAECICESAPALPTAWNVPPPDSTHGLLSHFLQVFIQKWLSQWSPVCSPCVKFQLFFLSLFPDFFYSFMFIGV